MTPASRRKIGQVLERAAREVDALPLPVQNRLAPILAQAHNELRKDLERWLAKNPDGGEKFTAVKYRQALLELDASMNMLEKRIPAALSNQMRKEAPRIASTERKTMRNIVEGVSGALGMPMPPLPLRQASVVADDVLARIRRHEPSLARYGQEMTRNIRRQLSIGLVKGETFEEMTRRMMGLLARDELPKSQAAQAARIASTFSMQNHYRAERLVRTEVLDSYNQIFQKDLEQLEKDDPGWLKRWDATMDGRVCPECRRLDGERVGVTENFSSGIDRPPLHPNCRCGITPWRKEWPEESVTGRDVVPTQEPAAPVIPDEPPPPRMTNDELNAMHLKMQAGWNTLEQRTMEKRLDVAMAPENAEMFKLPKDDPRWIEWMKTLPPEPEKHLRDKLQESMDHYITDAGCKQVNDCLRFGKVPDEDMRKEILEHIRRLDIITSDNRLEKPATVLRGVKTRKLLEPERGVRERPEWVSTLPPEAFTVGGRWTDEGFSSATTNREKAKDFAGLKENGALLTIEVPAGKGVMPIGDRFGESELLLGRGTEYTVVDVKTDPDGFRHVRLRVTK